MALPALAGSINPALMLHQELEKYGTIIGPSTDGDISFLEGWCALDYADRFDLKHAVRDLAARLAECYAAGPDNRRPHLRFKKGEFEPMGDGSLPGTIYQYERVVVELVEFRTARREGPGLDSIRNTGPITTMLRCGVTR